MEQERCEERTQNVPDLKEKSLPSDVNKSSASSFIQNHSLGNIENQDLVNSFASSTPAKTVQPLRSKKKELASPVKAVKQLSTDFQNEDVIIEDVEVELSDGISKLSKDDIHAFPDKCKTLVEFLDRIDTAVKLLALHKKLPTFQNICTLVEVLTKRKFTYSHLAQIKYILPEAFKIEKIIVHDDKTLCMTPDMKVTIQLDMIEARPHKSMYMSLRQVFYARLLHFFKSHGEECDIPEAMLPEPFNQREHDVFSMLLPVESSTKSHKADIQGCNPNTSGVRHHSPQFVLSNIDTLASLKDLGNMESHAIENEALLVSSASSHSIRRHFSQKLTAPEKEKTQLLASPVPCLSADCGVEGNQDTACSKQKDHALVSESTSMRSPVELIFGPQCPNSDLCESSPGKLVQIQQKLMTETPAQQTPPKRSLNCSDDKISTGTISHASAKRSLSFPILKDGGSSESSIANESKECDDQSLQNTKKILAEETVTMHSGVSQMVGDDQKTRQSSTKKHQQMFASLTDMFKLTNYIFRSVNHSLITRQELLQKLIAENLDIVDESEVEEQLELLVELIPDWICRKTISGDVLYSIRKVSDVESIRARLAECL